MEQKLKEKSDHQKQESSIDDSIDTIPIQIKNMEEE